jgi:isopenicillin-N epimerase
MPEFGRAMLSQWMLDPELTYLNHGTVGATPRPVLAAQQALRDAAEREPARFQLRELADVKEFAGRGVPRMRAAAADVAAFVRARPDDLVFVDNATAGVSAVLRSLDFRAGDEVLVTDLGYGSVKLAAEHVLGRVGGVVRVVELPGPPFTAAAVTAAILAACTPRTRLLVVDHVTSGTALVLPVREIVAQAHAAGVRVLVDGAHAPGMLDLDIPAIGADWYTGNLHKWAMAPRASGILWATPEAQRDLHPAVLSWGLPHGFHAEFDLLGTRDATPWLAAPAGIAFLHGLGLEAVRGYGHAFAWGAVQELTGRWGTAPICGEDMVGMMATVLLPPRFATTREQAQALKDALLFEDRIEVHLFAARGRAWLRLCGQVYNDADDLARLVRALERRAGAAG